MNSPFPQIALGLLCVAFVAYSLIQYNAVSLNAPGSNEPDLCGKFFSSMCYDSVGQVVFTNDTRHVNQNILLPSGSLAVKVLPTHELQALANAHNGTHPWLSAFHLISSWRATGGAELEHLGHFSVAIGSAFHYRRLLATCGVNGNVCGPGQLLLDKGSDDKDRAWRHGNSWSKAMLPHFMAAAYGGLCPRKVQPWTSVGITDAGFICANNAFISNDFVDVYGIESDYDKLRTTLQTDEILPDHDANFKKPNVLIFERGGGRAILNGPDLVERTVQVVGHAERVTVIHMDAFSHLPLTEQLSMVANHSIYVSREGSHMANFVAAQKGASWIEINVAGVHAGISRLADVIGMPHFNYLETSFKRIKNNGHGRGLNCLRERLAFSGGDGRTKYKVSWPPCFWNAGIVVDLDKYTILLKKALAQLIP